MRTRVIGQRRARLRRDLFHQRQRHLLVGLVLEDATARPTLLVAHHADEHAQGAVARVGLVQGRDVDGLARQCDHGSSASRSASSPNMRNVSPQITSPEIRTQGNLSMAPA